MNILYNRRSPNYRMGRSNNIKGICCHITGDSVYGQATSWLCNPSSKVSAHYVVEKNGDIYNLVADTNTAYHAGIVAKASAPIYFDQGSQNPNNYLIGIEVVSAGEDLTSIQYSALLELVESLCVNNAIPRSRYNIIGHYELDSVNRAYDPISSYSVDDLVNDLLFNHAVNSQKICNSPDYWVENAIDGKNCQGDYVQKIIKNYVAMFKLVNTFEQCLDYLKSVGIISDKSYWLQNAQINKTCEGKYVRTIITRMGKTY